MTTENTHKVPNVPPLRFPEFSGEWEKCTLGEIMLYSTDRVLANTLSNENYISTENMPSDFCGICKANNVPSTGNVIVYQKGDILLSNIRPYLKKVWMANNCGGCSADVFVMKADNDKCISDFLYYLVANDNFINYVMSGAKGIKMPRGDKAQIKKYQLSIPSKSEQYKITEFLHNLDVRITTQNKIIEDLKTLRLATNDYLQKHFEPAFNLSFAELGTDFGGLSGKSANDFGTGYPYITYMGVYSKNFVTEADCSLVTILPNETQSKVQKGDVLFTLSSETPEEVCYGSVYVGNVKEVYLNSFCFGVHITNSNVYSPYLAYFVNSTLFRKAVFPLAQGSTRFNLQKSDFLKKKFAFPSKEKQIEIYNTLQALDNKLQIEIALLDKYRVQKQYFLQQMFI